MRDSGSRDSSSNLLRATFLTMLIRKFTDSDIPAMRAVWNEVVEDANAFPQENPLGEEEAAAFFNSQSYCGVAEIDGHVVGLYIFHPNNVGRCGHIANASYAVSKKSRGIGVGEALVNDSLVQGARLGFRVLQFNAVAASNAVAIHIYEKAGFVRLGVVPGGFRLKNGEFEDIILFYHEL